MSEEELEIITTVPNHHGRPLAAEGYPALMDFEMDTVVPAVNGRPWRKACKDCLLRRHDPQGVGSSYQDMVRYARPQADGVFYCTHRTDNGEHRICACWAACRRGEYGSGDAAAALALLQRPRGQD